MLPDRLLVYSEDGDEVAAKVHERGLRPVAAWLVHWVENIAGPTVRPTTLAGYRFAVNIHLIPAIGAQWSPAARRDPWVSCS